MKGVKSISESTKDNVILFPKTVDYYQKELTRMLETERYEEAIQLLKFLVQCQGDDQRVDEEWKALLEWLQSAFPAENISQSDEEDDKEETESELLRQHVKAKMEQDHNYAKKMLDKLLQDAPIEPKLLALDQLAYIEHPQINDTLKRWVENVDLHPLVQFKVLQTLKIRGVEDTLDIQKCGEEIRLSVAATPLTYEEFPPQLCRIMTLVRNVSEITHPALAYFVEQTWREFLCFVYGSSIYDQLLKQDSMEIRVWAAALHHVVSEAMTSVADEEEHHRLYDINGEQQLLWEQACRCLRSFMGTASRSNH